MHRACAILWLAHVITGSRAAADERELKGGRFCQFETFTAECAPDEAILIEKAIYGRMSLDGVCVKRDYGYVGCQTDVRMLAHVHCSGRPTCRIDIPTFDRTKPCPDDLKLYLEARYRCVRVITPPPGSCSRAHAVLIRAPSGYLSSYVTNTTMCGSATAPWRISLDPGQRVNISLLDFSGPPGGGAGGGVGGQSVHCKVFAIVKDLKSGKSRTVCGHNNGDKHHVMLSTGSDVEIRIMSKMSPFLLKYQAVGCRDPETPRGGWFYRDRYDDNKAHLGCEDGTTWTLICKGYTWIGPRANCTITSESMSGLDLTDLPKSSALIIVVGIALIVGCAILVIGIVFLKRRYTARGGRHAARRDVEKMAPPAGKEIVYMTSEPRDGGYSGQPPLLRRDFSSVDENEYAYVEDYQKCTPSSGHVPQPPRVPDTVRPSVLPAHPCHSPLPEQRRKDAPLPGYRADLYNSLDGTQLQYRDDVSGCQSPTGLPQRHNPYNVLDTTSDDVKKASVTS